LQTERVGIGGYCHRDRRENGCGEDDRLEFSHGKHLSNARDVLNLYFAYYANAKEHVSENFCFHKMSFLSNCFFLLLKSLARETGRVASRAAG
jgi:hypothetical protein